MSAEGIQQTAFTYKGSPGKDGQTVSSLLFETVTKLSLMALMRHILLLAL
jgi:hypothetical protein